MLGRNGFWVFAYGSLLWSPGFEPEEVAPATLLGFRRSFCVRSLHWRGTPAAPGLVLALDEEPGAACEGLALRVQDAEAGRVLEDIRARELVSNAYDERRLPLRLADGREVDALAYVAKPDHPQYVRLDEDMQAVVIARARGERGPNRDYLLRTADSLRSLGIRDGGIEALASRLAEAGPPP